MISSRREPSLEPAMASSASRSQVPSMSRTLLLHIVCDARLEAGVTDYCTGILGAAVHIDDQPEEPLCTICGYLSVDEDTIDTVLSAATAYFAELATILHAEQPRLGHEVVADQDWEQNWKQHFTTFTAAPGLIIAPTWEIPEQGGDGAVIVMDPGMAFGTGHHQTTRLCLHFLHETINADTHRVLDVGAGTGILAMAAALYGAHRVTALDSDPEARAIARANIETNHLGGRVCVSECEVAEIDGEYDIVVANIVHDVLLMLAADLVRCTAPGGSLFLSGLAGEQQARSIVAGYGELGMKMVEVRADDQWYGVYLKK